MKSYSHTAIMFATTIFTSWAGCPQSRLYNEVVARGDRQSARMLTRVARQWDQTLAPAWLTRLVPRRLRSAPFEPVEYREVVAGLTPETLAATLDHTAWLHTQPCVRNSLRSVAFLEAFEAVVGQELTTQLEAQLLGWGPGRWPTPVTARWPGEPDGVRVSP